MATLSRVSRLTLSLSEEEDIVAVSDETGGRIELLCA